ncbi:hypothetical protein FDE76_15165 [Clostridium botulinum]|uniref:Uncharacterized protein n=3 Tax=Clostridium botulinum TaxID=1491 RepID=A0A0A0UZB4_CLOBO|nr:hypothetical protein CLL_0027 [Clostridium botulinum B str. Eklund 17B (NRP)]AIW54512.1 hypothetical protein [Clostridium botulinum]AIW54566.1 hypothetical protein [Clostridium botulinum]MBY6977861.1 hypothetical protein [Clostridium botulinum]MBY7002341.1 hypothetical protein [Clostridium botulinum]
MYNLINSLSNGDQKMFWLIFDLIVIATFHLIWFSYLFFKRKDSELQSIRKPLYYRSLQYILCICLGLLIAA